MLNFALSIVLFRTLDLFIDEILNLTLFGDVLPDDFLLADKEL